eukprot:5207302-Alexandrium_andersonii.AAC.1
MDPPALGRGEQGQLGRTRMLADRADSCLVRPLSNESIEHMRVGLSNDSDGQVVHSGLTAIED